MSEPRINYGPAICGYCGGTGKDDLPPRAIRASDCKACQGSGSILVAQPPIRCAHCNGSGRETDFRTIKCRVCEGTGWAHALLPMIEEEYYPMTEKERLLAELDELPDIPLDGELWAGRGNFQTCRSIVAGDEPDPRFKQIRYAVYSMPGARVWQPGEIKNFSLFAG